MIANHSLIRYEKKSARPDPWDNFLTLVKKSKTRLANNVTLVEKVLIAKLQSGDYHAFTEIFAAFYKDLVIFAMRFTKDTSDAEEIVQDTFMNLWEEHDSVRIDFSLKSYLLKVVQNKCIDWCRHKKIIQIHNNFIKENSDPVGYNTDNYILHSELQEQIDIALAKLPEEISSAFRLNRYKGLKYYEIADQLNVSVRTVEVRIGKALNMLRNHLKDYIFLLPFLVIFTL